MPRHGAPRQTGRQTPAARPLAPQPDNPNYRGFKWVDVVLPGLQGAQALELVQWVVRDPGDQHVWVQGIQRAFNLDIGLGALVNDDRTKVFFNYDVRGREGGGAGCGRAAADVRPRPPGPAAPSSTGRGA